MIEFKILKESKKSFARLGLLETSHGIVQTPSLVPVATQGVIKTLNSDEVLKTNSQILIANTFHLHLKPGEKIVKQNGGLHQFMNWPRPLMTDSGGYQVFSLGFGRDFGTGKILQRGSGKKIKLGHNPKNLKIMNEGVFFSSPVDGRRIFLGPRESIKIQESLGADIIFAFDECTSPMANYAYTKKSLDKTHAWAKICLETKSINQKNKQALYAVVQGGKFKDLREASAKFMANLSFQGFGIGGEFGNSKSTMAKMLNWTLKKLPKEKPRHLLGIGHPEDILKVIKSGIDTFDCTVPTHYARHGVAFASFGRLDLKKTVLLKDKKPIDSKCACLVCEHYSRSYLTHLFKAKEITALSLTTFHNLYFFNAYIAKIRADIKNGKI